MVNNPETADETVLHGGGIPNNRNVHYAIYAPRISYTDIGDIYPKWTILSKVTLPDLYFGSDLDIRMVNIEQSLPSYLRINTL